MRTALFLALLAACKKTEPVAAAKNAAAICWRGSTCTEVYANDLVAETERWCGAEHGQFQRDAACKADMRVGACRLPSGSADIAYPPVTVAQASNACRTAHGQFVADVDLPETGAERTYSCMIVKGKLPPIDGTCLEERSVVDLAATEDKANCLTLGGVYKEGACPQEGRVGACETLQHQLRATRVFYASSFDAVRARQACDQLGGAMR